MKSVSFDAPVAQASAAAPIAVSHQCHSPWEQSRLPSWSPGSLYRGDDLPGVPLDCFTSSMIDDGSDPSWVPYEHSGCEPVLSPAEEFSESGEGSDEEPDLMEVDQD